MIETNHDLRNPTDMILLERVAKAVFHTPGIAMVQSITRPLGTPLDHTSIPFQISAPERGPDQQPALPAGPRRRPAQAGRRDRQLDQHPATAVRPAAAERRHARTGRGVPPDRRGSTGSAQQDRQLRRLLPAAAQLLLLGTTLFRHPDLRRAAVSLRRARRHRRADRPVGQCHNEYGQAGCAAAEAAGPDPATDRQSADQPRPDDDELRHPVRDLRPDRGGAAERDRARSGVRRLQDRRLLLPTAGSLQQLRVSARAQAVPLTRRQGRPDDHHPRRRSRYARRPFAHRRDPALGPGGHQGNPAGGRRRSTSAAPRRPTRTSRTWRTTT